MTVESIARPVTGLERVVGALGAHDAPTQLEALAQMDPLSVGLLTGKLVAHKRTIETPQFTVTVREFVRRP